MHVLVSNIEHELMRLRLVVFPGIKPWNKQLRRSGEKTGARYRGSELYLGTMVR